MEQFPGYSLAETVLFPLQEYEGEESRREEQVLSALAELKKEHEGSHLVFIYTGTAGFNSLSERYPFDLEAYHSFVQQWAGPVTIIYDAPFGGFLKREFEAGGFSHVSLILAAQETNGMTFIDQTSPFQGDGTEILIRMIESGVTDVSGWAPFDSYRSEVAEYTLPALDATDQQLYGASSWVIGTPSIDLSGRYPSPVFSRAKRSRSEAYAKLDPVRRLASLIATGCDMRGDASCEEFSLGPVETSVEVDGITATLERLSLAGPEVPAQRVFDLLKAAALRDYGGEMEDAFATYDQFLQRHDMVHGGPVAELRADEANLREQVRESVDRITGQVRERLDGLQGKFTRQIWLLLAGVPDYRSPLVSDLVDAGGDLLAWESALHDVKADEFPITPRQIDTSSRPEMLVSLGQALAEAGSDDLVLFIFSGRGIEIAGERYLATANVLSGFADAGAPAAALLGRPSQGQVLPTMDELVSIAEVAEVARDRWFVGIYDAQFTQPVFEPGSMDGVLDKHLNSVRPSPPETAATQIATSMELERFPVSAKDFLGKHVHIWWEGSLTERLTPPTGCQADPVRKVRSPMTAALLAALQEEPHGTYRDWILRAQEHPCLGAAAGFGFVAQGSTDLPRFASGTAATQIPYFLSARERRDANLHAADAVTQFTSKGGDHPLFALSRAAVLLARVEFARSAPSEAELEQSDWLTAALGLLVRLRQSEKDKVQEAGLDAEVLDLYARALVLNGEDDQARSILLAAPPPQLASKTLQDRLLDLTEAELRQSPTGILEATGAKLADLGASANPDVSTRFEALSSLYEAPRGQYRIITPTILSP